MVMSESRLQALLGERLRNLQSWLGEALALAELRDAETVCQAKAEILRLTCQEWGHDGGEIDGALAWMLAVFVERCPGWAEKPETFRQDLSLSATPPWELTEFYLLVASALADHALVAFERCTKKQLILAAMLYADAVEAREHWDAIRGPARARNPNTRHGELHKRLLAVDEHIAGVNARRQTAQKGAKAKLANDPKYLAKVDALELWKERHAGKHPNLRTVEQFAAEVMRRCPVLNSPKVICGWSAKWTKEAKAGRIPAC